MEKLLSFVVALVVTLAVTAVLDQFMWWIFAFALGVVVGVWVYRVLLNAFTP